MPKEAGIYKKYGLDVSTISPAEMEAAVDDVGTRNLKAKGADPRQFYDPAPLEQLAKEGFTLSSLS